MTPNDDDDGLLERLGGPQGILAIVDDMYGRVLKDNELAPFFASTSMERLRQMQYEFLVSAFGGPIAYSGAELASVHRGRGITGNHFARFCSHFIDAMEARGADARDLDQALIRLSMFKDRVTGEGSIGA
jgi:hemoglobin